MKPERIDALVEKYRQIAAEASAGMNERCVQNFNEAVAKADALADECEIRRVLYDIFGSRSYCVTVERG